MLLAVVLIEIVLSCPKLKEKKEVHYLLMQLLNQSMNYMLMFLVEYMIFTQ